MTARTEPMSSVRAREVLANARKKDPREEKILREAEEARKKCSEVSERLENKADSAEKTLAKVRATLDKWDSMKARFGEALDAAIRNMADAMSDMSTENPPDGPPSGAYAHGYSALDANFPDPERTLECDEEARGATARGSKMETGIKSHEYRDSPPVLKAKVQRLASLLRKAGGRSAIFTGAGVSTSAGIPDFASKKGSSVMHDKPKFDGATPFEAGAAIEAVPTFTHRALAALHSAGHVEQWVQQNHDGLAQKAGFPQRALNEIHGGWFDPSNPVVPMTGGLRPDLAKRLRATGAASRLVLSMGTSMSGVFADQLVSGVGNRAKAAAEKARKSLGAIAEEGEEAEAAVGASAGTRTGVETGGEAAADADALCGVVIVNVQQTRLDGLAALRIFAPCDEVMRLLASELAVRVPSAPKPFSGHETGVYSLPYDPQTGRAQTAASAPPMVLDLRKGSRVRLGERANPPMAVPFTEGTVEGRSSEGHYSIAFDDGVTRVLGLWMLEAANGDDLEVFPVVPA